MSSRFAAIALSFSAFCGMRAQTVDSTARPLFVNDELERYTRVLQVGGDVPLYPWSLRQFGLRESERLRPQDDAHPWATRTWSQGKTGSWYRVSALPAQAQIIVNSGFPYGYNDGPIWAGRGITTAVSGGVAAVAGPVSVVLAPLLFRAENVPFTLRPNGQANDLRYGDAFRPEAIDTPQRFGDGSYQQLDPGNSSIRLDAGVLAAGFSTANEHWGPARDHPIVLGNNAPGFAHVFVGTSHPANVYLGHVQARLLWGGLRESDYTPMRSVQPRRFATGLVVVGTPRGLPGLEIGGGRFFEALWSDSISNTTLFTRVFSKIFKKEWGNPPGVANDNQLASIFARWVFPRSGMEFYGEFGHEDYPNNLRDFVSEPDHSSSYLLGMQHVRVRTGATQGQASPSRQVFRGELLNSRVNQLQITVVQQTYYTHPTVGQGHTNLGQVLGSVGAFGGGAAVMGYDSYTDRGRWTVEYSRIMRAERRTNFHNMPDPEAADVVHALTFNGLRFRGRLALTYEATAAYELNRYFRDDVFNLRLASGVRYGW